jgi:hypothetical protein
LIAQALASRRAVRIRSSTVSTKLSSRMLKTVTQIS